MQDKTGKQVIWTCRQGCRVGKNSLSDNTKPDTSSGISTGCSFCPSRGLPVNVRFQSGITLIEILVTVVILAIGLLGLAGLQMSGLRNNQSAYYRTQVSALAYDIMDRMRSNPVVAAQPGGYSLNSDKDHDPLAPPLIKTCYHALCTTEELAEADLYQWYQDVQDRLPDGRARITKTDRIYTVEIYWNNSKTDIKKYQCDPGDSEQGACVAMSFIPWGQP